MTLLQQIEAQQRRCLRVRSAYLDACDFEPAFHIKAALNEATLAAHSGDQERMEAALRALQRVQ